MENRYLNINAHLAEEVLSRGLVREFRAFLALKATAKGCGAYFRPKGSAADRARRMCGWESQRTMKRRLRKLVSLGWLGVGPDGTMYVRPMRRLCEMYGIQSRTVHQVSVPAVVTTGRSFRAALFSIAVGKMISDREFALVRNMRRTHPRASSEHSFHPTTGEKFCPETLSVQFLANRLSKSKETIHRWKKWAEARGMLSSEGSVFEFSGCTDTSLIRKAFPGEAYRTFLSADKGCVCVRLTDELESPLKYKTRAGG